MLVRSIVRREAKIKRETGQRKGERGGDALKMKIPSRRPLCIAREREIFVGGKSRFGPVLDAKMFRRAAGGKYLVLRPFRVTKLVHKGIEGWFCKQLSHAAFSDSPRNCEEQRW